MKNYNLFVVGDRETVELFRLLGAHGMVVEQAEDFKPVLEHLQAEEDNIGGLLLGGEWYDPEARYFQRLQSLDMPMIFLPDAERGADAGRQALEALTEKAMGMKLNLE